MKKYLIIFSILIILYYMQKYCIQSEVDKFLITQNVIEKFAEATSIQKDYIKNLTTFANQLQNGGLDISNGIILGDNLKIQIKSNNNPNITDNANTYLKITDTIGNFKSMCVKNMDISGILTVRQTTRFFGSNNFSNTNNPGRLNISSLSNNNRIHSENGDLTISSTGSASDLSNYIKLNNNTCISGNLTINGIKPILIKVIQITNNNDTDTNVSHTEYPGISLGGYSGYLITSPNLIEFNAYKITGSPNWCINFTPTPFSPTTNHSFSVILTFFHKNIVEDGGTEP
jgi:hypothetical protein